MYSFVKHFKNKCKDIVKQINIIQNMNTILKYYIK